MAGSEEIHVKLREYKQCSYVNNSECFLSRAELIRQLLFFDWQD